MAINDSSNLNNILHLARSNKATATSIIEAVSRMTNREIGVALVAISTRVANSDNDVRSEIAGLVLLEAAERLGFKKNG
jgi:N-acyl-D-aspartate/D-glutamate deacylase